MIFVLGKNKIIFIYLFMQASGPSRPFPLFARVDNELCEVSLSD